METPYPFTKTINDDQLLLEITAAGLAAPLRIDTVDTSVSIVYADALSSGDESTLDTVVANHVPVVDNGSSLAAQIAILTAYITNISATKQNAARAQVIAYMAPRLGVVAVTAINAATKAMVGDP